MDRTAASGDDHRLSAWPSDAVEVGHIIGAWGVKGWLRVAPLAAQPDALLQARRWYLRREERPARPAVQRHLSIRSARQHADGIVASVYGLADRDAAQGLAGCSLFVARADFPATTEDEFYWVDLIGLDVINRAGEPLGQVAGLLDTGVHSVLRVVRSMPSPAASVERLIPFVAAYIDSVDRAARLIRVDWGLDY